MIGLALGPLLLACGGEAADSAAPSGCSPEELCVVAGQGVQGFNGEDLPALETLLYYPSALELDPQGRWVVVDFNNMLVRALDEGGSLVTLAGNGVHNWSQPGSLATESPLENPVDVAMAEDGSFFILPLHEQRVVRVDPEGTLQSYAGSGEHGDAGDGGPALEAELSQACGIALSSDGTLYIADTENHRIRAVAPDGLISGVTGCGEAGFRDGLEEEGCLSSPQRLHWQGGALYIADTGNHALRRWTPEAGLETLAGTGTSGSSGLDGPATQAQLSQPYGLTVSEGGAIYIADSGNHRVLRIEEDGSLRRVAGTGTAGLTLEGGPPLETPLHFPADLALSPSGELLIADMLNGVIQSVLVEEGSP